MRQKTIIQTKSIDLSLKAVLPDLPDEIVKKVTSSNQPVKSVIVIPLITQNKEFGWFCVFSARDELASAEMDFLGLFAKQIEMAITIADLFQAVREQAVTDALTGLYNRRYFEEALEKEVQRAKRQQQPFSVIGIDLDFLKKINDTYGHFYGDLAIKTIADVLKSNARSVDVPARIGGEEFNVLLPGISSDGAMIAAERIRKSIEKVEIETIGHITAVSGLRHTLNIQTMLKNFLNLPIRLCTHQNVKAETVLHLPNRFLKLRGRKLRLIHSLIFFQKTVFRWRNIYQKNYA